MCIRDRYRVPAVPTYFIVVIYAISLFRASLYRATYCTKEVRLIFPKKI